MRNTALRAWTSGTCSALALALTLLGAQLPPDVQVDRLWLRAERQTGNDEYWRALQSLDEILDLQTEHDVAIPESFWFSHAVASHRAGLPTQAAASATRYVESVGRNGEHYLAALELLDAAEAVAEREAAAEREADARRAARQAATAAQVEATATREGEMAKVAAELARLAPGMEMVVIPAGSFRMGCVSGVGCHYNEKPVHQVTISQPLAVGKYEVTFAEWDACVSAGGCSHRPEDRWGRGRHPVIGVSWDDAQEYVGWLSQQTGASYRLLSESEWEYAARAGSGTACSWGNEIGSGRANCESCGSRWDNSQTAPVGSFTANGFGLHDMHGNTGEWVQDCWNESYNGAPSNGSAWQQGDCSRRFLRGGSWGYEPWALRSAYRFGNSTGGRYDFLGFRVARTLTP